MIRVRDLELITREVVRSTFREDATRAIVEFLGGAANIVEDEPVTKEFREFPADLIIKPKAEFKNARPGAIYFVNSNDKLNEALMLHMEARQLNREKDFEVIALIEDADLRNIKRKFFQRAQNRELGSRLNQHQKAMMAAKASAETKLRASLS